MPKNDLNRILNEIERIGKQVPILKTIHDDDDLVVSSAFDNLRYMEGLNDKEKESFEHIQMKKPIIASLLVKMSEGSELDDKEKMYLIHDLEHEDDTYVSSKHIRLTLVQEALLDYYTKQSKSKKNHSEFIREMVVEKLCSLLDDME